MHQQLQGAKRIRVTKRVPCWACKDTGWVQRGSKVVEGELFSRNYKPCDTCSINSDLKEPEA